MQDCIFCKIANKEIPAKIVYEDNNVIAFNDINPNAPIHILVVPKEHVDSVLDIDESNTKIVGDIHVAVGKIAREQGFGNDGFRLITNCGENAGQTIKHLHYHILGGMPLGVKLV